MIERKQKNFAKIAVYAVIHEIYFEQFEGLRESLNTYHHDLIEKISKNTSFPHPFLKNGVGTESEKFV